MAKRSKIVADQRRREIVARYAERRAELKKRSVNPHLSEEERAEAMAALHALPRDASPTRLRNRDVVDGRPRGYLGKFGLSRVRFRKMALDGELPGVRKSSW
ncbi:small subunit ribosomal protein S14 [Arcanobacterium wilhelmae]|uniref:Small ribosomal subunit protein uS14 n=1 Tax=Arcanobacterium wilhelmae TaxID=1803177 RepID=A0ABT9N9T5_9ACTO|nr:30S ribosomal protein S14 [Arcanobacterium wilhelmae]MDP9800464.1 small subunit ribosomal protein S14 [Arcanobacterium wilhelmae]WFN89884.1 30S ribosomal protein S14 [Arcanobacterium wilhelmae]